MLSKDLLLVKLEEVQMIANMSRSDLVALWNRDHKDKSPLADSEYCRMTLIWSMLCEIKVKIEREEVIR